MNAYVFFLCDCYFIGQWLHNYTITIILTFIPGILKNKNEQAENEFRIEHRLLEANSENKKKK